MELEVGWASGAAATYGISGHGDGQVGRLSSSWDVQGRTDYNRSVL